MLNRIMEYSIRIMVVFAALSLGAIMLLTTADVTGRYLFNAPVGGTYELTEILMGFFAPVAIMFAAWKKEHINVDILYNYLPRSLQYTSIALAAAIQIGLSAALAFQSFYLIDELLQAGTITPVLSIPYWPAGCAIALSFTFMTLIYLLELFHAIKGDGEVSS